MYMVLWRKTLRKKYLVDLGETLMQNNFSGSRKRFDFFISKSDVL